MKVLFTVFNLFFIVSSVFGQPASHRLQKTYQQFENDEQLKHAISSLYVIDAKTGEVVFDKNSQIGLAPASTQKIITAATAFELLGKNFRYKTELGYEGNIKEKKLFGNFYFIGSGDPTLGSWRWENTKAEKVLERMVDAVEKTGIKSYTGSFILTDAWGTQTIPNGWIWEDIGNYYGAGAAVFNWHENQFDVFLKSGNKIGDSVTIVGTNPRPIDLELYSEVVSAAKGTGDNAYIYFPTDNKNAPIRGTIPIGEANFKISGSFPDPEKQFFFTFLDTLSLRTRIGLNEKPLGGTGLKDAPKFGKPGLVALQIEYSPTLDSIIYWFLKKSINLYGEALVKTFAYEKQGLRSTDSGTAIVKKFWGEKGIDEDELNIYDGSGLSPLNRITTHAQVEILKYARSKDWFPYFFDAFPEYNSMKIKSGTISDVKGYCGYHTSKSGKEYIFSFLVNNYSGRSSTLVSKMFKVLDELK